MKILLYTDLAIREDELFWHRDLGLLTRAFRELGHDASLIVHRALKSASKIKNQKSKNPNDPVIWATTSDVRNPHWWQSHKPDLVILGLWTRPKYDPIRRAALSATPRVIERADSDGMRTASCGLKEYAQRRYDYFRSRTGNWPCAGSFLVSCLYSAASVLASPWMERRLAETLRHIPDLAVETPGAADLWCSLVHRLKAATRVHHVPHPVQADLFQYRDSCQKQKRVVSVGRWESYQKNLPLLISTLAAFLDLHPDWSGVVVGSGLRTTPSHPRMEFLPGVPPASLAKTMETAMIFLFSSRYESFLLAGAEALVAGCSVVGPETLVATRQLVEIQGCSTFGNRRLSAALEREGAAWIEGQRDPVRISRAACAVFSPQAVAQALLLLPPSSGSVVSGKSLLP